MEAKRSPGKLPLGVIRKSSARRSGGFEIRRQKMS
nr:MAG TPA: hypothetical protein [Caudoviricetes sp.]